MESTACEQCSSPDLVGRDCQEARVCGAVGFERHEPEPIDHSLFGKTSDRQSLQRTFSWALHKGRNDSNWILTLNGQAMTAMQMKARSGFSGRSVTCVGTSLSCHVLHGVTSTNILELQPGYKIFIWQWRGRLQGTMHILHPRA